MRKRVTALFLTAALILAMVPGVMAVDSAAITDIRGHWAEQSILWALDENIFQGTTDTTFTPNGTMTRGMFVTVLGRMAGVEPQEYQDIYLEQLFTDVPAGAYYAPYVNWAVRYGIAKGTSDGRFSPDTPVTRQQMAVFLVRFASIYNYELRSVNNNVADSFLDAGSVSGYAAEAVETMRMTGLLNGRIRDGGYIFDPNSSATRAECAVVFQRLVSSMQPWDNRELTDPNGIQITGDTDSLGVGEWTYLEAAVSPAEATNQTVTWVSSNPAVATVGLSGKVTAVGEGTAEIYAYTWNGLYESWSITCTRRADTAYDGETYAEKCIRVFGEEVPNPRRYYQTAQEAASHMVTITIRVWDFTDSSRTTKTTKYLTLQVHENMADTYTAIFEEIYNGSEQFPIKAIGCYRWEPGSEHMPGLAVDINPNENYECTLDGTPTTGSYWKPGEDPYSIPADGDVVNAFRKYGFGWGGNWRTKKDYMHFSYFST